MVKRSNHPSIGFWATPGGFVELKEDISEGAARELEEETCVKGLPLRQTLARIEELVSEYHVEKIVLGYPKNMNNTIGERAQKSLEFKEMLERRTGLEVIMWDERLSTVAAEKVLIDADLRRSKRKKVIDMMAAVVILQNYLDSPQSKRTE